MLKTRMSQLSVFALACLLSQATFAAGKSTKAGKGEGDACQQVLGEAVEAENGDDKTSTAKTSETKSNKGASKKSDSSKETDQVNEARPYKYTLQDFLSPDPEINPMVIHPWTVIPAAQKYAHIIGSLQPRKIRDPLYKIKTLTVYPAFTGEIPESNGKMIIGQYEGISELVKMILSQARGDDSGKMILFVGPAGTGKTETLTVLDRVRTGLSASNPDFFGYTYEWIGLDQVPALQMLVPRMNGEFIDTPLASDMRRSPFTLLREDIQEALLEMHGDKIAEKTGYPALAWLEPDPKTEEMIREIIRHEVPDVKSGALEVDEITQEEYINAISKYVRIVRRKTPSNQTNIIRFLPENPNFSQLFVGENPIFMMLPMSSALRYQLSGKVLQQDGFGLLMDEVFRNDPALLNTLLEVAQNQVAETDIGPAVHMDVFPATTANDESIDSAKEDGDMKAILDRSHTVPMRLNLHPHEISKTALLMLKPDNFRMQKLEVDEEGKLPAPEKLDLNTAYPLPTREGHLEGLAGRYALSYVGAKGQKILIAPHVMEMMGIAAAATRLVTDPKKLKNYLSELQVLGPESHYYTSVKARLDLILGKVQGIEATLRADLYKLRWILREGEQGISSRDIESWFKTAIDMAVDNGRGVLTPDILDQAFRQLMDQGAIKPGSDQLRAEWLNRYRLVKLEYVLKALHDDVRQIVSGDGERAERLYDTVEKEIVAMANNRNATEYTPDDGSPSQPINQTRLRKIQEKFKEIHGREFNIGFLLSHLTSVSTSPSKEKIRNTDLLEAIKAYLVEAETDITEVARDISEFYKNQNKDPHVQKKVTEAEARLARYGYDRTSFQQAVDFWHRLYYEREKAKQARQ